MGRTRTCHLIGGDMDFTYLASPYTHHDDRVRRKRFEQVAAAAAGLMAQGEVVFSPIAHSHPIDLNFEKPESGEFWKKQDEPFLMGCNKLVVLRLAGWEDSKGLAHEIAVAHGRGIPVEYL